MATGTYKPQIRVYDLNEAGLKFERHTDAENIDFVILSEDWTKSVHLQNDRTLEFHAQGGIHAKSRIPKFGRAMTYNPNNCDLIIGASGNQVYRLNVDQGRFLAPFEMDFDSSTGNREGGVNCLDINPVHGLLGFGLENGTVEFWDPRSRNRVSQLAIGGQGHGVGSGVTSLSFRNDGLNVGFGTFEGNTLLFDLRASEPYVQKDQGFDFPIKKIGWIETDNTTSESSKVFTADKKIVKIWDRVDGKPYTAMEPSVDINDVAYIEDSGMFLMANEGRNMHAYYIPSIGPAPKWCSHLDNFTEELEEESNKDSASSVYANFRFVEKDVLKSLNLEQYIGTNLLKPYMHGYFVSQEIYDKARAIANPFAYEEHRQREIKKRMEKERESRIRTSGAKSASAPKVKANKALAQQLNASSENGSAGSAIVDDRFKSMFEDPEFEMDESSKEFKAIVGKNKKAHKSASSTERERMRGLTAAELSDEERVADEERRQEKIRSGFQGFESDSDAMSESEEEEEEKEKQKKTKKNKKKSKQNEDDNDDEYPSMHAVDIAHSSKRGKNGSSSFGEDLDDDEAFEDMYEEVKTKHKKEEEFESKVQRNRFGELEYTFVPEKTDMLGASKSKKPKKQQEDESGEPVPTEKDMGRTKQRFDGRRRANRKAFRGEE